MGKRPRDRENQERVREGEGGKTVEQCWAGQQVPEKNVNAIMQTHSPPGGTTGNPPAPGPWLSPDGAQPASQGGQTQPEASRNGQAPRAVLLPGQPDARRASLWAPRARAGGRRHVLGPRAEPQHKRCFIPRPSSLTPAQLPSGRRLWPTSGMTVNNPSFLLQPAAFQVFIEHSWPPRHLFSVV